MGAGGCNEISAKVTAEAASPEAQIQYQALLAAGAPLSAIVEEFQRACPADMAGLVREELAELPAATAEVIVRTWAMAAAAGKRFEMQSVRPERPVEYARERRVRVAIDMDEDGVIVSLSHVPGRHASWYRPAALVA